MKITVRNLGVLKEAQIDLKPLTIFIGPNNGGKTWLAYVLAGILGPYGTQEYIEAYTEKQVPSIYEPLDKAIEQILIEGNATIDLRELANEYGERYFNEVAEFARNWMSIFLDTHLAHFVDMDISLSLAEMKEQFLQKVSRYSQRSDIALGPKGSLLTILKRPDENKLYAYTSIKLHDADGQEEQIGVKIPPEEVSRRLVDFVFTAFSESFYPRIRFFPTERIPLITNHSVKFSRRSWPLSSFLNMLNSTFEIGSVERTEREKAAKRDPKIRKYVEFAEVLEKQILEGDVDFSTPEPNPRRELLFRSAQDTILEIAIASSLVKELASLVLYLRYLAQPEELLIIDEPEMNLHPAAQVKIIEFLAMLVNAGLPVLITTHSTYIVDHLINLMDAYKHKNQDEIVEMFLLEAKDAFIDQEKVSVYLIDDGKVQNVLDQEGIIDWQTFGDVTQLIENIHFEL